MSDRFKKGVAERQIPPMRVAIPQVDPSEPATPEEKRAQPDLAQPKALAAKPTEPTAKLFAEIPESLGIWLGHYKVDSGKNKNEIMAEALALLRDKVERQKEGT